MGSEGKCAQARKNALTYRGSLMVDLLPTDESGAYGLVSLRIQPATVLMGRLRPLHMSHVWLSYERVFPLGS